MVDIYPFLIMIGTVIGFALIFVGLIWKFFKCFDYKFDRKIDEIKKELSGNRMVLAQHGERLNSIEEAVNKLEGALDKFEEEFRKVSGDIYQMVSGVKKHTGNPTSSTTLKF